MSDRRPRDVFRLVVLGESAAYGTPDPAFSFGRILEAMLRRRFPKGRFEVIDAALVAINSHVILPIARDCADAGVDLFVAYIGHNEVVGPFGAGTVFGRFTESMSSIRLGLGVRTTAVGQGLASLMAWMRSSSSKRDSQWRGMEFFVGNPVPADDFRLDGVYRHFERNLADIVNVAVQHGAGVILCTTACNLRDCPPFASRHKNDLAAADEMEWKRDCEKAATFEKTGRWSEAERAYRAALTRDDRFAETHFRLAWCLAAGGNQADAAVHFRRARDLDCLRFRADSRINEIIRRVSTRNTGNVSLVDVEAALEPALNSACGDLFYEHVHFRFEGNYRVAQLLWPEVVRRLPASLRGAGGGVPEPPTRDECAQTLALSDWDRHRMLEEIIAIVDGPPFTNQLDHERRMERLREELLRLESGRSPSGFDREIQMYRDAIKEAPADLTLRRGYGGLLAAAGRNAEAMEAWHSVLQEMPDDAEAAFKLGCICSAMGGTAEAEAHFRRVIASEEWARTELAAKALYNWGNMLRNQNRTQEAIKYYRASLEIRPDYVPTLNNLGSTLVLIEAWDEAIQKFRQALDLDPRRLSARRNLAMALARKGLPAEAAKEYRELLRLDPDDREAKRQLEMLDATSVPAAKSSPHRP